MSDADWDQFELDILDGVAQGGWRWGMPRTGKGGLDSRISQAITCQVARELARHGVWL